MTHQRGPSLVNLSPRSRASLRLVCFGHAGAGASIFRGWGPRLHPDVELLAVQLPGRESRRSEAAVTDPEPLLAELASALQGAAKHGPYVLFGHSLGAVLAYLTAWRAHGMGASPPARLILSAAPPPRRQSSERRPAARAPAEHMDDRALMAHVASLGGSPAAVLRDRTLSSFWLPLLRADLELLSNLTADDDALLPAPITLVCGAADPAVTPSALEAWRGFSTRPIQVHVRPGGHFYGKDGLASLCPFVNEVLEPHVGAD